MPHNPSKSNSFTPSSLPIGTLLHPRVSPSSKLKILQTPHPTSPFQPSQSVSVRGGKTRERGTVRLGE
ncbi:hypothetical protein BGX38DRAFT_1184802 [Terfezia claveryi]|nr:hypothetical protein BGX38DRAFT_1184802 [Terfezia claveryi]